MRRRCDSIIRRQFPNLSEDQLRDYYSFAKKIKMSMLNYITFNKLADIWLDPHLEDELNYRILRTVCYYYIREHLVTAVLTSQKLQAQSKPIHLNSRRQLMKFFRNEDHWWFVLYGFEQILYSVSDIERKLGSCISVRPSFPNY